MTDGGRGTDRADPRDVVLTAARVLLDGGEQTSRTIVLCEGLARALGAPGTVLPSWGHVEFVTGRNEVRSATALPETVNMGRVQAAIDAVHAHTAGGVDVRELLRRIQTASRVPPSNPVAFTVAAGLGVVALSVLWGVTAVVPALLIGAAAALGAIARRLVARAGVGVVSQIFLAALIGGVVGGIAFRSGLSNGQQLVAIGPALVLVPGPQLMNGGLDLAGGRVPLGLARLASAIITIFAISAGILAGLALFGTSLPTSGASPPLPLPVDALCAGIAAGAYAVFFTMPWRYLPIPVVVGGAVHALHSLLITAFGLDLAIASGIGALLAGVLLVPVADRLRIPFAGVGFASVVAMMPSVYIHRAVSGLLALQRSDGRVPVTTLDQVGYDAATAVLIVVALVLGVVLPIRVYRALERTRGRPGRGV